MIDGVTTTRLETLCLRGGAAAEGGARDGEAPEEGPAVSPVVIEGRTIAKTFWGKAWCENLEALQRLREPAAARPDLRAQRFGGRSADRARRDPGAGQRLERFTQVEVKVTPVAKARWKAICKDCAGAIDSLVELLQGRFSKGVMERICRQKTGLFPSPEEIKLSCSCPDWAGMCKHVAAVLYGIGARLDQQPELLFRLREVDEKELIAKVGKDLPLVKTRPGSARDLENEDLAAVFGLDMADSTRSESELSGVAAAKPAPANTRQQEG